ncbi:unnamed protein product [Prunus armeniaca]
MDSTHFCHQRSPSSDRLLSLFSFSPPSSTATKEELNGAKIFVLVKAHPFDSEIFAVASHADFEKVRELGFDEGSHAVSCGREALEKRIPC